LIIRLQSTISLAKSYLQKLNSLLCKKVYEKFIKFTANIEKVPLLFFLMTYCMNNYSISSFPDQDAENSSLIELKGELSIQHIHEIKKELETTIKNLDTIKLLVYDASIIDLTILQYLLSLKRSENALNKSFEISFELNDDLTELLKHAGFKNIENLQ